MEQHLLFQQGALLPAQQTTLSEHLNPNPQHFLLFLSYFREPYKGSFLLHSSHGCANLSTAQFCWHTCYIPCFSVLASCRSGNARFDLYLVQLLQVSVPTFSEERIVLNSVLMAGEEIALVLHKEREFRHCLFWQGDHSGCLYIRTVGLSRGMQSGTSRLKYLGEHGRCREVDLGRVISCFHF